MLVKLLRFGVKIKNLGEPTRLYPIFSYPYTFCLHQMSTLNKT